MEFKDKILKRHAFIKGELIPYEVMVVIEKYGYCCYKDALYFFNKETLDEIYKFYLSNDLQLVIQTARTMVPNRLSLDGIRALSLYVSQNNPEHSIVKFKGSLYPYQKNGLTWLLDRYKDFSGAMLADDMGLGKTAQVIAFIAHSIRQSTLNKVIILVPNSLIANWINEFKKFTSGIVPYVHWGPERAGFVKNFKDKNVIITTYSTLINDISLFGALSFDVAVFDEASLLKNPDSQRCASISKLKYMHGIAITGTPFENSLTDLWSITNILATNYLGTRADFEMRYGRKQLAGLGSEVLEYLENRIKLISIRRMKSEVLLELPEKINIYKPLTMSAKEEQEYKVLEHSILTSLQDRSSAFSLIANLRKFTAHPLLSYGGLKNADMNTLKTASSKFEYLDSLIAKIIEKHEKVIVFANHVQILEIFKNVFGQYYSCPVFKIDGSVPAHKRQLEIDRFSNADGAALMFLNPVTAGMGLNITSANHVVHYSRQWNPALEEQATARAFRNGQTKNVNVYYLYLSLIHI